MVWLRERDDLVWRVDGALVGILLALVGRGAGVLTTPGMLLMVGGAVAAAAFAIIPGELRWAGTSDLRRVALGRVVAAYAELVLVPLVAGSVGREKPVRLKDLARRAIDDDLDVVSWTTEDVRWLESAVAAQRGQFDAKTGAPAADLAAHSRRLRDRMSDDLRELAIELDAIARVRANRDDARQRGDEAAVAEWDANLEGRHGQVATFLRDMSDAGSEVSEIYIELMLRSGHLKGAQPKG